MTQFKVFHKLGDDVLGLCEVILAGGSPVALRFGFWRFGVFSCDFRVLICS